MLQGHQEYVIILLNRQVQRWPFLLSFLCIKRILVCSCSGLFNFCLNFWLFTKKRCSWIKSFIRLNFLSLPVYYLFMYNCVHFIPYLYLCLYVWYLCVFMCIYLVLGCIITFAYIYQYALLYKYVFTKYLMIKTF